MQRRPSQIVIESAGKSPVGVKKAESSGRCVMCGGGYEAGELVTPFMPASTFTDYGFLKCPESNTICQWCAACWNGDFMQKTLLSVVTKDGIFPSAKNIHIAYWLNNPPEGEWIWLMGQQKSQHIVWKAPVNRSQEVFQIYFTDTILTVRKKYLFDALAACKRLNEAASINRKGAPIKSPFKSLSRSLDSMLHGSIRNDLHQMAVENNNIAADIKLIQSCTPGELWALTSVLYAEPERPETPIFSKFQ